MSLFVDNDLGKRYTVNVFYEGSVLVVEFAGDIPLVTAFFVKQLKEGSFVVKFISG